MLARTRVADLRHRFKLRNQPRRQP